MEKREFVYNVGGNVNYFIHYGKQYGDSLKTKMALLYNLAMPLTEISPKQMKSFYQTYWHSPVYGSTLLNSQDMELAKVSFNR